jgi:hypothetical protein
MPKADKAKLIAARLARVPWWRSTLLRFRARRNRVHKKALERLPVRGRADAVREEDVQAWLSAIGTGARRRPRNSADS